MKGWTPALLSLLFAAGAFAQGGSIMTESAAMGDSTDMGMSSTPDSATDDSDIAAGGSGCPGHGKPGVILHNGAKGAQSFVFYRNEPANSPCSNYGQAHDVYKKVTVAGNGKKFVALPRSWRGHIQRDGGLPATWAEFQLYADPSCPNGDGKAHGDISVIQGNDGPATIASTSGPHISRGFTNDIRAGAPKSALGKKNNGQKAIKQTETSVQNKPGSPAAKSYSQKKFGQGRVYWSSDFSQEHVDDVASPDNCMAVHFG